MYSVCKYCTPEDMCFLYPWFHVITKFFQETFEIWTFEGCSSHAASSLRKTTHCMRPSAKAISTTKVTGMNWTKLLPGLYEMNLMNTVAS